MVSNPTILVEVYLFIFLWIFYLEQKHYINTIKLTNEKNKRKNQ